MENSNKLQRPTGVWILTIYAAIFAGIFPLVAVIALFVTGKGQAELGMTPIHLISSIGLAMGIIASAIGAWKGSQKAKMILLILITIHYLLIGLNNAYMLWSGLIPKQFQARVIGRVLRGLFYPAIYIWYFRKPSTQEFYSSNSVADSPAI